MIAPSTLDLTGQQETTHISDQSLQDLLSSLFHRVEKSLLQYAVQADLWIPADPDAAQLTLDRSARWQRDALKSLARLFERRGWPPHGREFPADYGRYNDISLSCLLPEVVKDVEETLATVSEAKHAAVEASDSEAVIALNRLQLEHRLLLAELRQRIPCEEESAQESGSKSLKRRRRSQQLLRNDRPLQQATAGKTSA